MTFSHLLFGRVLKREGVIFPPYEGGLKEGADFNSQVSLREVTHPQPFPQSREGKKKYPPYEGGLKVGADFREGSIIKLLRLLSGDRMEVCRFRDMVYVKKLFIFVLPLIFVIFGLNVYYLLELVLQVVSTLDFLFEEL